MPVNRRMRTATKWHSMGNVLLRLLVSVMVNVAALVLVLLRLALDLHIPWPVPGAMAVVAWVFIAPNANDVDAVLDAIRNSVEEAKLKS